MEELDGDVVRISSRGKFAERDIVQVGEKNCPNHYILLILFVLTSCSIYIPTFRFTLALTYFILRMFITSSETLCDTSKPLYNTKYWICIE